MKKIIMLAFIALGTLIISCGKDEDKNKSKNLEGTWYLESITRNGIPEVLDECMKKWSMTFSGNSVQTLYYKKGDNNECVLFHSDKSPYEHIPENKGIMEEGGAFHESISVDGDTMTATYREIINGKEIINIMVWKRR